MIGLAANLVQAAPIDVRADFLRALGEFDEGQRLQESDGPRARQLFRSAAKRFDAIIGSGVVNGRLEFNAGNAHLQADDLGNAMLHYLRAERLIPRDPLLADNLFTARKRCLITLPPARKSVLLRNLFFWHYETSFAERSTWALAAYVLFWGCLVLRSFVVRPWTAVVAATLGVLTLALASSLALQQWNDQKAPPGVVTGMDVVVYKGPGAAYQRLFEQPLQPGVEFTLRERRAGWWNVELPDGRAGWIDETSAAVIPYGTGGTVP